MKWRCAETSYSGPGCPTTRTRRKDFERKNSDSWIRLLEIQVTKYYSEHERVQNQELWFQILREYTSASIAYQDNRRNAIMEWFPFLKGRLALNLEMGLYTSLYPYCFLGICWKTSNRLISRVGELHLTRHHRGLARSVKVLLKTIA